jgi:hypothetical protein
MRSRTIHPGVGLATLGIFAVVVALVQWNTDETVAQPQASPGGDTLTMPTRLGGVLISLGLRDEVGTDWKGEVSVTEGKILAIDVVQANPKANITGNKFDVKSVLAKKMAKKDLVNRPILRVTLDAPQTAKINVTTNHGNFDFVLADVPSDSAQVTLMGHAAIQREDGAIRLTSGSREFDYPAIATAADGKMWLVYCEYQASKGYLTERVLAGDFEALVPKGNGDRIRLRSFDGKTWSAPIDVTDTGLDIWRPSVTVANGKVHVSWAQQVNDNWDIYHRVYSPPAKFGDAGTWSETLRVTTQPRTDYNVVSTTAAGGQVWLAWQAWEQTQFQIRARAIEYRPADNKVALAGKEFAITNAKGNHWNPAIATDSKGNVYIAYDDYEKENYDIRLARIAPGGDIRILDIANSARCEARASIAVDKQDRVWIAYELGDEQWGKDFSTNEFRKIGFNENPGFALYTHRTIDVKVVTDDRVWHPKGDLQKAIMPRTGNNKSLPRVMIDGSGLPWVVYRHHPRPLGTGEVWNSFATCYDGENWTSPRKLAHSENLMDNRPALAPFVGERGNGLLMVFSGDARNNQQTRKRDDLFAAILASPSPRPTVLAEDSPAAGPAMKSVHPNEAADVARIREARYEHDGKKLQYLRGEFHRHTEYTAHRDGDGLLEDSWRYALDAASLDWMGNADHDNGHHDEYSWWQIQKMADLMHNPPNFVAVQSYERSNKYPNGHRNVIMPKRGIRPLPRGSLIGTEDKGTPDTKILYLYLKQFGGMCSSHTSGTGMGTDWRDNDPVYEPVVEVYQGHRHNYEHFGAPRSATEKTQIGGYEPKGFIWNAFAKGYKLGFQASSDHVSTHMSYGMVLTDDVSRQGIIDAFKRRHSYAATDNLIVEFRCGKQIMGDIFETKEPPTFDVKILGTAPVTKVSIVRDAKYIHVVEPKEKDVKFTFTDREAEPGTSYYYVRVEQSDANLAWASPMWITYKR